MVRASDTAYVALKDQIQRGMIAPGQTVDEADAARRLAISRTPVREALLRLQSEGFVEMGRGRGIRVLPLSSVDMREMYQMISGLEVAAVSLLVRSGPDRDRVASLSDAVRAMETAGAADRVEDWGEADELFHRQLMRLSGNRKLYEAGCQMRDFVLRAHRVALRLQTRDYRDASTRAHAELIETLLSQSDELASVKHYAQRLRGEEALVGVVERFRLTSL